MQMWKIWHVKTPQLQLHLPFTTLRLAGFLKQSNATAFKLEQTHLNSNRSLSAAYFCIFLISLEERETSAEIQLKNVGKTKQVCFFWGPPTILTNSLELQDLALLKQKLSPEFRAFPSWAALQQQAQTAGTAQAASRQKLPGVLVHERSLISIKYYLKLSF